MRKILVVSPDGWPFTYESAPPGYILVDDQLCFKSEYRVQDSSKKGHYKIEGYNSAGEFLCIEKDHIVQPVSAEWQELDE